MSEMIDGLENRPVQHVTNSSGLPETNNGTFAAHQIGNLDLTLHSHSLKAGSLLCIPEEASLENCMRVYKEQVNKQLAAVASAKDDVEALKETNMVLTVLTKQLLEQNDVLVSSLMDVAREGECRAVQMQKRLRESAQATKDVVLTMSDWGEEIRDLIIRKCQAENLIHEAETSLLALRNENHCLKDYNENLWHDIQSLLNIIKEARTSGHWEMGLVTFCEISPEDVFGPICRLSAKHPPDPFLRHDINTTDDLVLLHQPLAEENSSAHNEALCLQVCSDLTPAVDTTKTLCNGFIKSNESRESHSGGSVVLEQEQSQCTGLKKEHRSVCQDGLLKGRPPSRARSLLNGLQGSWPEEPYETPCGPCSPADCRRVLFESPPSSRGLDCSPMAEPSRLNCAAQTEERETSSVVMGTQTDFLLETCLPSGNEVRDQELGSLRERLNLAIQDAQSKTLLAMQLQAHLDASAMQVELRDQALQNLEKKLTMSREDCDHLKKDMISVQFELEKAQQAIEKERTLRAHSVAEAEQLTLTVQHLREALVSSKRAIEEARRSSKDDTVTPNNLPRVHDI